VRGIFAVDEPSGPRWELALDLLRRGDAFSIGPVTFRRNDRSAVEAAVASSWQPERVTEERARRDLEEARRWVEELMASDEAFRRVIEGSAIDYVLVDDYDIGSVALCRLVRDDVVWSR